MPELPEVETIKNSLQPRLLGRRIEKVEISNAHCVKHPAAAEFAAGLIGRAFSGLERRGKYLMLLLDDGGRLVIHLRMTGRLVCGNRESAPLPHTHIIFLLDDGNRLAYSDTRRFGCLWLFRPGEEDELSGIGRLGPEPFRAEFDGAYLKEALGKRKIIIKQGLLDQHAVAGLGNIYADELLFLCGVKPTRKTAEITDAEWEALAAQAKLLLRRAVENCGTTFSDYLDGEGRMGQNQNFLQVYQRKGLPCFSCGTPVAYVKAAGRGTSFCPNCQK
ncbi:MAG: DNA-formamidopyrimidine glycosylase [Clostridiales bacterium]|nr:DNA-formamidopyrimidine glycosylase [Clostridiales bacterium]